jgi:hypothetical protein
LNGPDVMYVRLGSAGTTTALESTGDWFPTVSVARVLKFVWPGMSQPNEMPLGPHGNHSFCLTGAATTSPAYSNDVP